MNFTRNSFLLIQQPMEIFNQFFQDVFRRKIQTEVQGVQVYTMGHTDHLLYLIFHAFKHFLHSGFGIRQVCDIVLYANTYGSEIDWEYLYRSCAQVHAENFAAALFDIGEKTLNFDRKKACYPELWQRENANGDALLEDLLDGGVFGDSNMSRKHSSNITLQAVSEDKKGKESQCVAASLGFSGQEVHGTDVSICKEISVSSACGMDFQNRKVCERDAGSPKETMFGRALRSEVRGWNC